MNTAQVIQIVPVSCEFFFFKKISFSFHGGCASGMLTNSKKFFEKKFAGHWDNFKDPRSTPPSPEQIS